MKGAVWRQPSPAQPIHRALELEVEVEHRNKTVVEVEKGAMVVVVVVEGEMNMAAVAAEVVSFSFLTVETSILLMESVIVIYYAICFLILWF